MFAMSSAENNVDLHEGLKKVVLVNVDGAPFASTIVLFVLSMLFFYRSSLSLD